MADAGLSDSEDENETSNVFNLDIDGRTLFHGFIDMYKSLDSYVEGVIIIARVSFFLVIFSFLEVLFCLKFPYR